MNFLDRAVAYIAPATGLRRAAARAGLDQVRSYDGAMMGRRTSGWRASNASANVEVKRALPHLRARSRDLMRNTWWGARIKSVVTAHAVGTGITPKPMTGDKAADKAFQAAWKKWKKARFADAEGQLSFDGLVGLATGCIVESGEVLARIRSVKQSRLPRGVVPIELQLLEPDHLDSSRDKTLMTTRRNGLSPEATVIDQGIEYDIEGKRLAYWIHPVHPGARGLVMPTVSIRIDAADMLHGYRKDRIGQGRGVPWCAPVMLKGRDVADLEEAVVIKARIEACLAAFIKTNDSARTLADRTSKEPRSDRSTRRIEQFSPGMVAYLEQGEEVTAVNPSSSSQFEAVMQSTWMTLAAGAGITYDQLTGDLRRANFSSLRAGKIEFRRVIEQFQHLTLCDMLLDPFMERWVETAMDSGVLPRRADGYPIEWIMPANEPIDPLKDMQADILAVRSGRMTWPQFVSGWGFDPDVQLDEIADWFKSIDLKKVVLDVDPRLALASTKGNASAEAATESNTNVKKD
jgi:lambda family phage portal protein